MRTGHSGLIRLPVLEIAHMCVCIRYGCGSSQNDATSACEILTTIQCLYAPVGSVSSRTRMARRPYWATSAPRQGGRGCSSSSNRVLSSHTKSPNDLVHQSASSHAPCVFFGCISSPSRTRTRLARPHGGLRTREHRAASTINQPSMCHTGWNAPGARAQTWGTSNKHV